MTDNQIGYRRPPTATRFKPGESGNPGGRPRRRRNFLTDLVAELDAKVGAGTRQAAIAKALVTKAALGDTRALATLLPILAVMESARAEIDADDQLSPEEEALLAHSRESEDVARSPKETGHE